MRERQMFKLAVALVMVCGSAAAYVVGYHVEPVKALWSGQTRTIWGQDFVSQGLTINFDELDSASGAYCELFAGSRGGGGAYHLSVLTNPGGTEIASANAGGDVDHEWVKFKLSVLRPDSIVKGKKLTFKFTRSGGDSIQFYYDSTDKYKYGCLTAPPLAYWTGDLACRVYGRMDTVGTIPWGATCFLPDNQADWGTWADSMEVSGATWGTFYVRWDTIEKDSGTFDFGKLDDHVEYVADSADIDPVAVLIGTPKWASSRIDLVDTSGVHFVDPTVFAPPRRMDCAPDSNPWVQYLEALLTHENDNVRPADKIHTWSIWNEPNEGCTLWHRPDTWPGWTGWWRTPNQYYHLDTAWQYRCSLYVQLCSLAAVTIRSHEGHTDDKIVVGELGHVELAGTHILLIPGKQWLRQMYATAPSQFWNVISAHPYQVSGDYFNPREFAENAETLRAVMRANDDWSQLWDSEADYGHSDPNYPGYVDSLQSANSLCKAFTSTPAQAGLPGGTFDRICWWISCAKGAYGAWGLFAPDMRRRPGYFAFKQVINALNGKRLNGRVMVGDSAGDAHIRMYEFEDPTSLKKTWVCWKNAGEGQGGVNAKLPATTDTLGIDDLHYSPPQGAEVAMAGADGWLPRILYERPVFITEGSAVSRPEVVAESLRLSPLNSGIGRVETVHVSIRNRGSRSTPESCTTWVWITWNDSTIDSMCHAAQIGPGQTVPMTFVWHFPEWFYGDGLLAANVNPGMRYVEKEGTDDNQAYLRLVFRGAIGGTLDATVPPGGKTDAPLLVCGLSSMSFEKDSTGQTPADSARILFAWYGQRDSVVQATDTTAWFPFCTDTVLQYPHGCGVYRVYAQFRDSGANDSPFYGDSTDSIVVFDSVPPAGSIIIEDGGRYASNSMRMLHLAASDSASGVCNMRCMNRPRVDLVENGGFDPAGGCWSFTGTGSGYDTSLQMARLAVAPAWESKATQFVPAESISAYSGDSCVLEASILAHMHDGEATGDVSFWFWSTSDNPEVHDTLWELVDSACYSGDLLSLTGRYNLSTRFLLAPPAPESGWVWQGGMVRVRAQGVDGGTGTVWCDNVGMNAYEPQSSGYAWWGPYDSLAQWDIGSTAGQHVVGMCLMDSAGAENATPYADTVILDATPPVVDISLPDLGQLVSGLVEVTGWAYDPVEVEGDTFFESRRLLFRSVDSTNWLPVEPDSVSFEPAWPDSMASQGPAVHLGYWNTLESEDGVYYLMLTASDSAGNTSSCTTWVMVANIGGGGGMGEGPEGGGSGMGEGSLYIGSSTGAVLHLSDDLAVLDTFSVSDSGSQAYVTSILEVGNDSLLVLDAANKRIHKLHRGGQHRRRLVSGLSQPADLKQDTNGNFWLADRGWNRIGKFRSNGTLVFVRGGLGADSLHFRSPEGIAVKGGLVYVADAGNNRIAVWDTSGHFKTTITGDFENPTAVFVADNGTIYLTDGTDGKLKGITPLGGNIVTIGTTDSSKLKGLVPSQNRHSLFSLASEPNKVYKLRIQSDESRPGGQQSAGKVNLPKTLSLAQPFPNPARTRLNIAYALPRQTRVVLKLYDVAGKLVTTLANGEQKPGYYNLTWNRQDTKGRGCACGVYFCTLSAENKRFSRKVILTE